MQVLHVNCYLVRYAELGIKSDQTRRLWLKQLRENIVRCLDWHEVPYRGVRIVQGRLLVFCDEPGAHRCLGRIVGVSSVSHALELPADIDILKREALRLYRERNPKTFRVTSQRITKGFSLTSQQINEQVGEAVYEAGGKVSLTGYELNIRIEVINKQAFIFTEAHPGVGGLPLGVQQRAVAYIDTERDLLAALLFMRRGCPLHLIVQDNRNAGQYLRILNDYACAGLPAMLVRNDGDFSYALSHFFGLGFKVIVSGDPLPESGELLNLCPCEIYDRKLEREAFDTLGVVPKRLRARHLISAGGAVFNGSDILVIRRSDDGTWVLPKGKVKPREMLRDAAAREIGEEAGLPDVSVGDFVGVSRYTFRSRGASYTKDVFYYLCESPSRDVRLERLFDHYLFVSPEVALGLVSFENDVYIISRAMRMRNAGSRR